MGIYRRSRPDYPVSREVIGDLVITDHSARFQRPAIAAHEAQGSLSVTIDHLPGTRRLVEYAVGSACFAVEVNDAHPEGESEASAIVSWDSSLAPKAMLERALLIPSPGCEAWEYIDFGDNWIEDGVTAMPLTQDVVDAAKSYQSDDLFRLNAETMSVLFQDVNGGKWVHRNRPEVIVIHGLQEPPVSTLDQLLAASLHPDLTDYLPVIRAREPEIFPVVA